MKMPLQQKTETLPKSHSSSHLTNPHLVHRKCACGEASNVTGTCSECNGKRLLSRQSTTSHMEIPHLSPIGDDEFRSLQEHSRDQDVRALPSLSKGHDFSRIPIHASREDEQGQSGGHSSQLSQMKGHGTTANIYQAAAYGVQSFGTELPHRINIQRYFGRHDVTKTQAHIGGQAAVANASLRATAYTTGNHVAFREHPDLYTAAHEAAHVIQQRSGLHLARGVGQPGDRHERHADSVARLVVQGKSAEALLDSYAPSTFNSPRGILQSGQLATIQKQDADPSIKSHTTKGKITVYSYTEGGKITWIDPYKIVFLGGQGFDVFLLAKAKAFSTFGSLFIMAHATLESDFGAGNLGGEYKNLFSVMGGAATNVGTSHGNLQKYSSYEEGLEAYVSLLGKKWPATVAAGTGLYYQSSFTPDDVNKAFRQYSYYNQGGQVYLGDKNTDYGNSLFERMAFIAGPLIMLVQQKLNDNRTNLILAGQQQQAITDAVEGIDLARTIQKLTGIVHAFGIYLAELQTAKSDAAAKLAEHKQLKKAGQIKPPKQ